VSIAIRRSETLVALSIAGVGLRDEVAGGGEMAGVNVRRYLALSTVMLGLVAELRFVRRSAPAMPQNFDQEATVHDLRAGTSLRHR
jgi:hypothetical protein